MGRIVISVQGSFGPPEETSFSAEESGHAVAVGEAIDYLASDLLPRAVTKDHECHKKGQFPANNFKMERR